VTYLNADVYTRATPPVRHAAFSTPDAPTSQEIDPGDMSSFLDWTNYWVEMGFEVRITKEETPA